MLFKYNGFDASKNKVKAKIEANSLIEAKAKLKSKKIIYIKIEELKPSLLDKLSIDGSFKIDAQSLSTMSSDLSIYLQSGISLLNAVRLIGERHKGDKKLSPFFESVVTFLDEGKSFHKALELQKSVFLPEFYLQSIRISEDGGILQTVLVELAEFLKEQDRLNKQINSAMAYPVFILFVSVAMVGFMLSFIVPKIVSIFEKNDQALPPVTAFVISAGNFVNNYYHIIIFLIVGFVLWFGFMMKKSETFKYTVDKFMLKIPFVGSLLELNELSRFAYMNSILINSGVPIVQSIKLSANISGNSVIKKLFHEASTKVVEGEKLSRVLEISKIYRIETSFIQAVAIGEETSQLSVILQSLSNLYSEKNKDKITVFLSLLEPALMLVVGSIIGVIVVAMLLPIFSMNF